MKLQILLVPSRAAAVLVPRRLAAADGKAIAGLLPMKVDDLVRALAEPALLGRGLLAWDHGHGALLVSRLLDETPGGLVAADLPRAPLARVFARTFSELRLSGIAPDGLETLVSSAEDEEDRRRLRWVAQIYRSFNDAVEGRFADPATNLRAATEAVRTVEWLGGAELCVLEDLDLTPLEERLVAELSRRSPPKPVSSVFPDLLRAVPGSGLPDFTRALFAPPSGQPAAEGAVELMTAPGEAAEVRQVVRRILRAAASGMPFEDMGILMPRPEEYARLFADTMTRLGIPHRLHPSLPLRYGRLARSLLLLFRCRGLRRREVMDFLTFAPVPFTDRLDALATPRPAQWDLLSREAGIVSGLERWQAGIAALVRQEEATAERETDAGRRERHLRKIEDARALLTLVVQLDAVQAELAGEATWAEWAERLLRVLQTWTSAAPWETAEWETVVRVLQELAGLGSAQAHARWAEVEAVVEARFEYERQPLEPQAAGGVHIGSLDALAGVPFRFLAIVGLVEGGFPGVLRPDPLLLDAERERLAAPAAAPAPGKHGQLSLFDEEIAVPPAASGRLATTQDRLFEARRAFVRAARQATERLVLSYPRADARSGRERLPSLFFVAAATARSGRTVGADALAEMVVEDVPAELAAHEALDASERDRARVRAGGREAVCAIAAGSRFFKQSHLASQARWSKTFTPYDGLVAGPPVGPEIAAQLDPTSAARPISASRLATFAQCGFLYLLQHVLRLEAAPEPEERMGLDPLERGTLFHDVAEHFLRERRDGGRLPVRDTEEERARLGEIADQSLDTLIAGTAPRFTLLWDRERARFHDGLLQWLAREARSDGSLPLHFEVGFGLRYAGAPGEPHREEPLSVPLGDERVLRVSGKIDRIDRDKSGGLVIRDYKTGRTPKQGEAGIFRGGRQLQISFYVLAAAQLFPGDRVVQAFLDYVDGGRRVSFDLDEVTGEGFRRVLRALVGLIAQGSFVQEPASCEWCDFKSVCGPRALIERRRSYKISDRRVLEYLRLRDIR